MSLSLLVCAAALAQAPDATPAPRLVIPEEIYLEFRAAVPPRVDDCAEPATPDERERTEAYARAAAPVRVAYADAVDLTGHVEGGRGAPLTILGRHIEIDLAEFSGGGRDSLRPGTLVHVTGQGSQNGGVRAERVEILAAPDRDAASKLAREVDKFKEKFWKKAQRLEDPALDAYLQRMVDRLIPPYVGASDRHFEVSVVKDPNLNAFALPDGTVVVHTGLIARMENEAQLATVLGHEMAHITQRHADRSMKRDTQATLLSWGSMLAALALSMGGKGDAGQGIQLMSSAILSGWSRAQEDEADIVGLRYLWLAGYDVREAPNVWRIFQNVYGDMTREQNFFYGSHSTGRDREHNLGHEIWKSYEPSGLVGGRVDREIFLRATATAVRENALLDLQRGHLPWAEWGIAKALSIAPEDARNYLVLGQLSLRGGARDAIANAIDDFQRAIELDPALAEAWRELGFARLRAGDRPGAGVALRKYLELVPEAKDGEEVRRALARTS